MYRARYRGLGAYVDPASDIGQFLCVFESWSSCDHAHRQFLETSDCPNADPNVRKQHQRIAESFDEMIAECLSVGALEVRDITY